MVAKYNFLRVFVVILLSLFVTIRLFIATKAPLRCQNSQEDKEIEDENPSLNRRKYISYQSSSWEKMW